MEYYEGLKVGKLTLLKFAGRDKRSKKVWLCQCECGNKVERSDSNLKQSVSKGKPPHCGCSPNWKGTNKRFKDLTGQQFGRLTVLNFHGKDKYSHNLWVCKCECSNVCIVSTNALETKRTNSCGCLKKELNTGKFTTHGKTSDKLYKIYYSMINRCANESNKNYHNYGGRGIKICDEWANDFVIFYDWSIANGYKEHLSIDRIDVNGNYEPSNCRWATTKEQGNNKRTNINITYGGKTLNLSQWAKIFGVKYLPLYHRVATKGMEIDAAVEEIKKLSE